MAAWSWPSPPSPAGRLLLLRLLGDSHPTTSGGYLLLTLGEWAPNPGGRSCPTEGRRGTLIGVGSGWGRSPQGQPPIEKASAAPSPALGAGRGWQPCRWLLCSLTGREGGHITPQSPSYALLPLLHLLLPSLSSSSPVSPPLPPENLWLEQPLASLGLYPGDCPHLLLTLGQGGHWPKKPLRRWKPPACCPTSLCKCAAFATVSSLRQPQSYRDSHADWRVGRGRRPLCPGLAAGTHTWVCLVSPHRCLQLLILCCQTQVGNLPRSLSPHLPLKGEGQSPFFGQRQVLASLWGVRGSSSGGE